IREINADTRRAHGRAVNQAVTARADHRAHRRRANHFAQAQRPESRGKHLGVGSRAPILQHDLRSEIAGEGTAAGLCAARLPDLILALHQDREQFLLDVAATIPALVDDHRFFVAELANLFFELAQARRVHRLNVQIADASAGQLVNFLAALFYPALITKAAVRHAIDGFDPGAPSTIFAGFVVESNFDLAIETIVQKLPVLVSGLDLLAANRNQVIANINFDPVFVGRAVLVNVSDAITTRCRVRLQLNPEMAG